MRADGTSNKANGLGAWAWFAIVALVALLAGAVCYGIFAWQQVPNVGIPPIGWLFLVLGVVFTLLVGGSLMFLLFYSSRKGRDF
jgi:phosphoglycerol transferase MdoB-like AlkP superfamily enzyme